VQRPSRVDWGQGMTSVTAGTQSESARRGTREPSGRVAVIHLALLQLLWLAAIAFGIYAATTS
jgi:hypothetical protein